MDERAAIPMLSYEAVAAAVDWLSDALGFGRSVERYTDDDGRVSHAEIELDGALVYLGWPGEEYESPAHHAEHCDYAARWSQVPFIVNGVHITVDRRRRTLRASSGGRRHDPARTQDRAVRTPLQRRRPRRAIDGCSWNRPPPEQHRLALTVPERRS